MVEGQTQFGGVLIHVAIWAEGSEIHRVFVGCPPLLTVPGQEMNGFACLDLPGSFQIGGQSRDQARSNFIGTGWWKGCSLAIGHQQGVVGHSDIECVGTGDESTDFLALFQRDDSAGDSVG